MNNLQQLADLAEQLKKKFPQLEVTLAGDEIALTGDEWDYHLRLEQGETVRTESEGFAERIAGVMDADVGVDFQERPSLGQHVLIRQ